MTWGRERGGWLQLSECPSVDVQGDSSGSGDVAGGWSFLAGVGPRPLLWAGLGWGWEVRPELDPSSRQLLREGAYLLGPFPAPRLVLYNSEEGRKGAVNGHVIEA